MHKNNFSLTQLKFIFCSRINKLYINVVYLKIIFFIASEPKYICTHVVKQTVHIPLLFEYILCF